MKKILLAFDGVHFSKEVFEFARQMNKHQPVLATGFFLPPMDYAELLYSYGGVMAGPLYVNEIVPLDDKILKQHIDKFKALCAENGINCKVHSDFTRHVVAQVREETRFADLLVISGKSFYENLGEDTQDEYVEKVLHKAECPVVVVPDKYKYPLSIIMAYDGTEQSVFAIKQFTYLFPEFRDMHALLVYLDSGNEAIPGKGNLEELLSGNYSSYSIIKLDMSPEKGLERWLRDNGDTMLVAGAYGRSLFSEMLKKSFINEVIRKHKVPVFVTHK